MNAQELKVNRAKWYVLQTSPFWGSLATSLVDVINPPAGLTACTDGASIRWDSGFLDGLSEPETRAVLAHEIGHNALGHFWRLNPRDPLSQLAADVEVNRMLRQSGLKIQLPAGAVDAPEFDGLAAEEVLAELRKRQSKGQPMPEPQGKPGKGQGKGKGKAGQVPGDGIPDPGACGSFAEPAPTKAGQTPAEARQQARERWERQIVCAVQAAQATQGTVPGEFARLAEACTKPASVDWKQETADFLRTATSTRNDWTRSARRHACQPCIYPRKRQNEVAAIVVVRDTSGSISEADLGEFDELIAQAQAELGCSAIVMDCDTRVSAEVLVRPGEPMPPLGGGGGTDFRPAFRRTSELIEAGETIAGLVYLTDLEGPEPEPESYDFPALWVCTTKNVAKSGRTVQIRP